MSARDNPASSRRRRVRVDPDLGVYVISVAAELAGVHAQTLRSYERHGLLDPDRTPAGDRRYSENDLHQLHRINELAGNGVSLAAVKKILDLQDENVRLRSALDQAHDVIHDHGIAPPAPGPDMPAGRLSGQGDHSRTR